MALFGRFKQPMGFLRWLRWILFFYYVSLVQGRATKTAVAVATFAQLKSAIAQAGPTSNRIEIVNETIVFPCKETLGIRGKTQKEVPLTLFSSLASLSPETNSKGCYLTFALEGFSDVTIATTVFKSVTVVSFPKNSVVLFDRNVFSGSSLSLSNLLGVHATFQGVFFENIESQPPFMVHPPSPIWLDSPSHSTIVVSNCSMRNCKVGGIFAQNFLNTSLIVSQTTFSNLSVGSGVSGAGIFAINFRRSSRVVVNNSTFSHLRAEAGAGLYAEDVKLTSGSDCFNVRIVDSYFVNCSAASGGAVAIVTPQYPFQVSIEGCKFFNSTSFGNGGAVVVKDVTGASPADLVQFRDSEFHDSVSGSNGGAVALVSFQGKSKVIFENCLFSGAVAGQYGGGLSLEDFSAVWQEIYVNGCRFEDCEAAVEGAGLAVKRFLVKPSSRVRFRLLGTNFARMGQIVPPLRGGAIMMDNFQHGDVLLRGVEVENSDASDAGGAIYSDGTEGAPLGLDLVVLRSVGLRTRGGGALFCSSPFIATNCVFERCYAASGSAITASSSFTVDNGTFTQLGASAVSVSNLDGISTAIFSSSSFSRCTGGCIVASAFSGQANLSLTNVRIKRSSSIAAVSISAFSESSGATLARSSVLVATGGAVLVNQLSDSASVLLNDCEFRHGRAVSAVSAKSLVGDSKLELAGTTISDWSVSAGGGGGAFFDGLHSTLVIQQTVFSDCSSPGDGGAVLMQECSNVSMLIANSAFSNCSAANLGGGLHVPKLQIGQLTLNNTEFTACHARSGGAVGVASFSGTSTVAVENCTFAGCFAKDSGGSLFLSSFTESAAAAVSMSTFVGGRATTAGFVLLELFDPQASFLLRNSTFQGGSAASRGGCVSAITVHGRCSILGCHFRDSNAFSSGGALSLASVRNAHCVDSVFSNCTADGGSGGAISLGSATVGSFLRSQMDFCSSKRDGGAVYAFPGSKLSLNYSQISDCSASFGSGGAVMVNSASASLDGVDIRRCRAMLTGGGGLASISSEIFLKNVSAENLSANQGGFSQFVKSSSLHASGLVVKNCNAEEGGAFYDSNSKIAEIDGLSVFNCSASSVGGAFYATDSDIVLRNGEAIACSAGTGGGFAHLLSSATTPTMNMRVNDSFIHNCSAGEGGGFMVEKMAHVLMFRGGIYGCRAGAGAAGVVRGLLALSGTSVQGNVAETNGGAFFVNGVLSTSGGAVFRDNRASLDGGALWGGGGAAVSLAGPVQMVRCSAARFGGAIYVDRDSPGISVDINAEFHKCQAATGGAVALLSMAVFSQCAFRNNQAGVGGAVYFEGKTIPVGLLNSSHSGNTALYQGSFAASSPSSLSVRPASLVAGFRRKIPLAVEALDVFSQRSFTCDGELRAVNESGPAAVACSVGRMTHGAGELADLALNGPPGGSGKILVMLDHFGLNRSVPYTLTNCTAGSIVNDGQCFECPWGFYSRDAGASQCKQCPTGAVCHNGTSVLPKWGYWSSSIDGVCDPEGSCSLPRCSVENACHGVLSLRIVSGAGAPNDDRPHAFAVVGGPVPPFNGSLSVPAMLDGVSVALGGLLSRNNSVLLRKIGGRWPQFGPSTRVLTVFLPAQCSAGYAGNLCTYCAKGFASSGYRECKRCFSVFWTLALSVLACLAVLAAVLVLVWITISSSAKKSSSVIAVGKVLWTSFQLMALASKLPLQWPGIVVTLFGAQETASSVNLRTIGLDCLLSRVGIRYSLVVHCLIVFSLPPLCILAAALFGRCCSPKGSRSQDRFVVILSTVLFLAYPQLCWNAFTLFPCEELATGQSYMSYDLNVPCSGGMRALSLLVGGVGVVVYCVGTPLLAFFLVWRKRGELMQHATRRTVGFLYLGYSARCYWFESVVLLKKSLFGAIILMAVVWSDIALAAASLVLFIVFYVLHVELEPLEDAPVDRAERLSSIAMISMIIAGLLFSKPMSAFERGFGIALIAASFLLQAAVVVQFLLEAWRSLRRRLKASKKEHQLRARLLAPDVKRANSAAI